MTILTRLRTAFVGSPVVESAPADAPYRIDGFEVTTASRTLDDLSLVDIIIAGADDPACHAVCRITETGDGRRSLNAAVVGPVYPSEHASAMSYSRTSRPRKPPMPWPRPSWAIPPTVAQT